MASHIRSAGAFASYTVLDFKSLVLRKRRIKAKYSVKGWMVARYPYIKQLLKSDKINFARTPSE